VFFVHSNHVSSQKLRRAIRAVDEDIGLAAVAKGFEHVGDRQNVALFVDEEAIAKKTVALATLCWRWIQLINDGADRGGERGVLAGLLGSRRGRKAAE